MRPFFVKIIVVFFILKLQPQKLLAQPTRFFIKANVMFPKAVSNRFFRKQYTGIYNVDLSVNYLLGKALYVGVGVDFKQFQYYDKFTNQRKGGITSSALSGLATIGYWKSDGGNLITDFNLGIGTMRTVNKSPIDSFPQSNITMVVTLQPKIGFYWYVDEDKLVLLGGTIGYTYANTRFDANALHYNLLSKEYTPQDLKLPTQYISFGLGFIYRIGKSSGANDFE